GQSRGWWLFPATVVSRCWGIGPAGSRSIGCPSRRSRAECGTQRTKRDTVRKLSGSRMLGEVIDAENHPRAAEPAGFCPGRLSLAESTTIEEHVLACEPCSRLLQEQPDDPLLLLVRQTAASDGTVPPSGRETAVPPEESGLPVPPGELAETTPPVPVLSAEA